MNTSEYKCSVGGNHNADSKTSVEIELQSARVGRHNDAIKSIDLLIQVSSVAMGEETMLDVLCQLRNDPEDCREKFLDGATACPYSKGETTAFDYLVESCKLHGYKAI